MPQRASVTSPASPFGSSLFSTPWAVGPKDRVTNMSTSRSPDGPASPSQSSFSKDSFADADVRTLDYLGLAETPQQGRVSLAPSAGVGTNFSPSTMLQPFLADLASYNRSLSRFRSYSVNAKEKYAEEEDDDMGGVGHTSGLRSGTMTPSAASAAAALAVTHAQIHQHNLAVQAFANQASASRPRARTAGVLDSPLRNSGRSYLATPSRLDSTYTASDLHPLQGVDDKELSDSLRMLRLSQMPSSLMTDPGDENGLEGPTRALWLGSIPASTTVSSLQAIFAHFGKIESTRVLVQKNCGFVNYEAVDSAMRAKAMLNGKEIFPGAGPVRIGFAKAPSSTVATPSHAGPYPSPSPDPHSTTPSVAMAKDSVVSPNGLSFAEKPLPGITESALSALSALSVSDLRDEILQVVVQLGADDHDLNAVESSVERAIGFMDLKLEIPANQEPSHARVHDAPKLREIRKRIDNNTMSQSEIEEIANAMLPEIAELSSDYLGNTVVQKLFEFCSEATKEAMLTYIAPHLAEVGVHKNGTWAAQKIIDVAKTQKQISMIAENLRPYTVPLFLDQYGNYVVQCCLKFGSPRNNFVFETMLSHLWEVAQGRFGARAMRACLESHHATKDQQRMLASAIALHGVQLAMSPNGALLLTWLLDTCTFPQRRTVLAPRLIPNLAQLSTHKVAYLTVLKVINQRNEPEARDLLLRALFFPDDEKLLENILSDQACGATLIFKVLTTPFFDEDLRADVVKQVKTVLMRLKVTSSQGYKRLMDEVGLSARSANKADRDMLMNNSPYVERNKNAPQHGVITNAPRVERQSSGQYGSMAMPFTGVEPTPTYEQYSVASPVFTPTSASAHPLQYHNSVMTNARNLSPTGVYSGYPVSGSFDSFQPSTLPPRAQQVASVNPSPILQGAGYPPPGFPLMASYSSYNQIPFYQAQQMPPQVSNSRRARVSRRSIQAREIAKLVTEMI